MKKLIATLCTVVSMTGMVMTQNATAQTTASASPVSSASAASFSWDKTAHQFGSIPQGKPVSVTYSFTNTGKGPLIITSVHPSCGCTTEDYSKESIAPGKKGFVKLTYNAASAGSFTKTTTVTANTNPDLITLTFTGEVVAAKTDSH